MITQTDKPKCHCGIFGIFGAQHAALQTYYGLHALQHRGQEASGIVSKNINSKGHNVFNIHKGVGLVTEVFADQSVFHSSLPGTAAIGHNRYSTTGASKSRKNIQPFVVNYRFGKFGYRSQWQSY
ncbi:MAG: hypothetical protein MZV64_37990 [Ignavibacteriales bacterium]|nr:hypothetical protein [Ignavibacteriales bacterium]